MLTENDVVEAVRKTLEAEGWQISHLSTTNQRGPDIEAVREGSRLVVEAKGETSSKSASARYGSPFDANQVVVHVARAVFTALVAQEDGITSSAIAFPSTTAHIAQVGRVEKTLHRLGIRVFWVRSDRTVFSW